MMPPEAQPGWDTGYFRMRAPGDDPEMHLFVHLHTKEIRSMPYDSREDDWFPIHVYMGRTKEEMKAAQP